MAELLVPKDVLFVDQVRRLGNGKADYRWAKDLAVEKMEIA